MAQLEIAAQGHHGPMTQPLHPSAVQPIPAAPADDHVVTPGGHRPRSKVHRVGPGERIDASTGRLRHLDRSGREIADFGPLPTPPQRGTTGRAAAVPDTPANWVAYTAWSNDGGTQITEFRTTWVVPPEPDTTNGQTIYLFNGLQDTPTTMILQPVLQWGNSPAGGRRRWMVASWAVVNGNAFYTKLQPVDPGDTLVGVMRLVAQTSGVFTWQCEFEGIEDTTLPWMGPQVLDWCAETLEAYYITTCSDYPDTETTRFRDISVRTGTTRPTITWSEIERINDCGQSAQVISNSATDGEVEITYRSVVADSPWSSLGGDVPPGAPVAALSRYDDAIDLFASCQHGHVHTAWWNDKDGWSDFASLGGSVANGAPVAAITRSRDEIDLFVCGSEGRVHTAWWRDDTGWSEFHPLGGKFPSYATVTAISRYHDAMDLFVCGSDGEAYTAWWRDNEGWSDFVSLGGSFPHGAPIAAITRSRDDIDLFVCDEAGVVHTAWWRDKDGWSDFAPLGGAMPSGAPVTALTRSSNDIDLYAANTDGHVCTAWWRDGDGWHV
jgi:hypothetical protein